MYGEISFIFLVTIFNCNPISPELVTQEENIMPSNCDRTNNTNLKKVEGKNVSIAVTQIILIKSAFVIAHAHDSSKLHIGLRMQSKAMFIPADNTQWLTTMKEVRVHPEYGVSTFSTLSLIKLDWKMGDGAARLPPVCWPFDSFNTNGELYAIGFTDENELLEKILFKLQYLDRTTCDEFYQRLQADDPPDLREKPSDYHCAFGVDPPKNCNWENGMAMASNASGHWILVGLSTSGPNCSYPGRFIDITQYTLWMDSLTTLEDDLFFQGGYF